MGTTKREQEIIDRADRGERDDEIATAMGIKTDSVKRIRGMLAVNGTNEFERMIRMGTIALGERIVQLQRRRAVA